MSDPQFFRVSFVCTGNICRSPMGEVVFRSLAERAGLGDRLLVTSRGTHDFHIGKPADSRTLISLQEAGYDGDAHRAAQLAADDIAGNELLIAMARDHESAMLQLGAERDRVVLMTAFDPSLPDDPDVFDPYYSDQQSFDDVLRQVERSSARLLEHLSPRL